MREYITLGEVIDAAKEKPETLQLVVLGEEGNGLELALLGSDFGAVIRQNLQLKELEATIQLFANFLDQNGIVLSSNHVDLNATTVLANAHRDKECQRIVNTWSKKTRKKIEKGLAEIRRLYV